MPAHGPFLHLDQHKPGSAPRQGNPPPHTHEHTLRASAWLFAAAIVWATFSVMLSVMWLPFCSAASRLDTCCSAVTTAACGAATHTQTQVGAVAMADSHKGLQLPANMQLEHERLHGISCRTRLCKASRIAGLPPIPRGYQHMLWLDRCQQDPSSTCRSLCCCLRFQHLDTRHTHIHTCATANSEVSCCSCCCRARSTDRCRSHSSPTALVAAADCCSTFTAAASSCDCNLGSAVSTHEC
jgi:hypothetical protein